MGQSLNWKKRNIIPGSSNVTRSPVSAVVVFPMWMFSYRSSASVETEIERDLMEPECIISTFCDIPGCSYTP